MYCFRSDICTKKFEYDKQHRTQCWPKDWLPKDVPSLRVIGINYDTNLSMWTPSCPIDGIQYVPEVFCCVKICIS